MKLKYYLRGVGVGVVITTLILTIAFNIRQQDTPNNNQSQSQTSNLDNILNSTAASSEKKTTEESTEITTEASSEAASSEESTEASTQDASETESAQQETHIPAQAEEQVSIVVNLGGLSSSEQVCDLLVAMGLISDATDFNNYLMEKGYAESIYPKTYTIVKGSDYETIARVICGL